MAVLKDAMRAEVESAIREVAYICDAYRLAKPELHFNSETGHALLNIFGADFYRGPHEGELPHIMYAGIKIKWDPRPTGSGFDAILDECG